MKKAGFLILLVLWGLSGGAQSLWTPGEYDRAVSLDKDPRFAVSLGNQNLDAPLLAAAVFLATNEVRGQQGLPPLAWSPELERSAWNHARRMAVEGFFSHEDPRDATRRTLEKRGKRGGVTNPRMAENIATVFALRYQSGDPVYPLQGGSGGWSLVPYGDPLPYHSYRSLARALVNQWMNSPGHRANILSPYALQLGCGLAPFRDSQSQSGMPMFTAVQNFQWYEPVKPGPALDPLPR